MAQEPKVTYRLIIGKGAPTMGAKDVKDIRTDIDNWFGTSLDRYIRDRVKLSTSTLATRLENALTRMYSEGITEALKSWIGRPSAAPGDIGVGLDFKGLGSNDERTRVGEVKNELTRKTRFFKDSQLERAFRGAHRDTLEWEPLSFATIEKKQGPGLAAAKAEGKKFTHKQRVDSVRHFVHSGALRQELTQNRRNMIKNTGVIKLTMTNNRDAKTGRFVSFKKMKRIEIGNVRLRLLPNISPGMLPGMRSQDWTEDAGNVRFERALGISERNLKVLGNTHLSFFGGKEKDKGVKRPLMQPVFTYFTLFRAPQVVAAVTEDLLKKSVAKSRGK